jgi:hypothetical protein
MTAGNSRVIKQTEECTNRENGHYERPEMIRCHSQGKVETGTTWHVARNSQTEVRERGNRWKKKAAKVGTNVHVSLSV